MRDGTHHAVRKSDMDTEQSRQLSHPGPCMRSRSTGPGQEHGTPTPRNWWVGDGEIKCRLLQAVSHYLDLQNTHNLHELKEIMKFFDSKFFFDYCRVTFLTTKGKGKFSKQNSILIEQTRPAL